MIGDEVVVLVATVFVTVVDVIIVIVSVFVPVVDVFVENGEGFRIGFDIVVVFIG